MWNSQSFYSKLLDGWEKSETSHGIPYYINHRSEHTQWDHPFLSKTMEEVAGDFDGIRYAAYRTAMKLCFIQKRLKMDLIDLHMISGVFDHHGFSSSNDAVVDCTELESILTDIYYQTKREKPGSLTIDQTVELVLNWLLNLYDIDRTGCIRVLSVKIGLVAMCASRLAEKYRYFFQQVSDYNNSISRKKLGMFLHDLVQLPEVLGELQPFGGIRAIGAAVESCFSRSMSNSGVEEVTFLDWLLREPQTLVWLPTMHRMAASETVKHESKCNICKGYPIIGFRYRCLKCFNFDICQQCFLTGRVRKKHKTKHPTQEYCLATTSKEDTKAFVKTVKNNLSKKKSNKQSKPRYLPINGTGIPGEKYGEEGPPTDMHRMLSKAAKKLADSENLVPPKQTSKMLQTDMPDSGQELRPYSPGGMGDGQMRELESIIHHLEDENRDLLSEIEHMYNASPSDSSSDVSDSALIRQQEKFEARQEILEEHNRRLEKQMKRLQRMLEEEKRKKKTSSSSVAMQSRPVVQAKPVTQTPPRPYSSPLPNYDDLVSGLQSLAGSQAKPIAIPRFVPTFQLGASTSRMGENRRQPAGEVNPNQTPIQTLQPPPYNPSPLRDMQQESASIARNVPEISYGSPGYGSWDGGLSQSRFSLPSPGQSRVFPEEEEELDDIIHKLESAYPVDMSYSMLSRSQAVNDDMLSAANRIGDAMSELVGQWET